MTLKSFIITILFVACSLQSFASYILIPMDADTQENHLKAYGVTFWTLERQLKVKWLLNYRGGSFLIPDAEIIQRECQIRGVSFEVISDAKAEQILEDISSPSMNQEAVVLEKAPKIAVYTPYGKQPWDDAVTMVLTYAEIPYETIYDEEVLKDELLLYDWLHLHHEDFTGQYGKFYRSYRSAAWYINEKKEAEALASKLGYSKVSDAKLDVALKIRNYVAGGGFMFAMCSATDSFDIALSAENVDICEPMFDGDGSDPAYQNKIDYSKTFAFKDFILERSPNVYEFSSIDMTRKRNIPKQTDYFSLMEYSAKWDPIPTMLTQNHTALVKGFMGQTTSFTRNEIKANVLVMGENKTNGEAKYIHGIKGKGFFTFYGGHDPEDYTHRVGDPKTELDLHPTSPGYRLILNNVLFPAAKKEEAKNLILFLMRIIQKEIDISSKPRGFHLITQEIIESINELTTIDVGFLHVFIKHTSASLTINENADPTVRLDFESHISKMVPENQHYYKHTLEGSDDMPAHIKSSLMGASVQIPITHGRLNIGMWQGIYLCEHRNNATSRKLVLTIYGN